MLYARMPSFMVLLPITTEVLHVTFNCPSLINTPIALNLL